MSKGDKPKAVSRASKADAWLEPKGEKIVEKTAQKDAVPPKFTRLQYYSCELPPVYFAPSKRLLTCCNILLVLILVSYYSLESEPRVFEYPRLNLYFLNRQMFLRA